MKESINLQWLSDMSFEAQIDGHKIYLDAKTEHGGKNLGPRPKPFMMVALAGCTGMDVVSILSKMRVSFDDFRVEVEGELSEEHPKKYVGMKVIYRIKGKDISREKVEKAVRLSRENYCGVSANYKEVFPVNYEIIYED
jgi:putative redox protein